MPIHTKTIHAKGVTMARGRARENTIVTGIARPRDRSSTAPPRVHGAGQSGSRKSRAHKKWCSPKTTSEIATAKRASCHRRMKVPMRYDGSGAASMC